LEEFAGCPVKDEVMEVDWADWAAESCGESRELISIAGISFVVIGNELKIEVGRY
jgi:hypothetical protein